MSCTKIAYVSIKGGVGKTTNAIMTATNLAARGYRVLYWDGDGNNSGTMFFTTGISGIADTIESKNTFEALSHTNIANYAVHARIKNIDIVPSHLNIFKLRGIGYNELLRTLRTAEDNYDFIVIDTAPTYDNLVINAVLAADVIITPIRFTSFDFSTAKFLQKQLYDDCPDKVEKWYLMYSTWEDRWTPFEDSMQSQFVRLFEKHFPHKILEVHIPLAKAAVDYTQTDTKLSTKSRIVGARKLATEINKLVDMFTDKEDSVEIF